MRFFTSDLHFDDDRLNLFGRDLLFSNKEEVDETIIKNWNDRVKEDDFVFVLGDVALTLEGLKKIKRCKGHKILIKGNYDETDTSKFHLNDELLKEFFEIVITDAYLKIGETECYMNHYPTKCKKDTFNLTGHIHGLWKVQRNCINVGVDANHFMPISEHQIEFTINGIRNFYDDNVFAGELECNISHMPIKMIDTEINSRPNVIIPGITNERKLPTIFLAGPIQDTYDWQLKAIDWLNEKMRKNKFNIASPRRSYEKGEFDYNVQVEWESENLSYASEHGVILFWLAKQTTFNPSRAFAQTTRFELAEWATMHAIQNSNIVVGIEKGFSGERYIRKRLSHMKIHDTLEETLKQALTIINDTK